MRIRGLGRGSVLLLGLLGAGWLAGGVAQTITRLQTGYMDVWPPQLLWGVLLIFGSGAAARVIDPVRRSWRRGSLAGMAMIGSLVVGYTILTVVLWNPEWPERAAEQDGETWFSLLIEAPFWIGVPLLAGALFGGLGWRVADRRMGPATPAHPG
jgi:uncharacterized membrane protein HdeD (DUF308 family)